MRSADRAVVQVDASSRRRRETVILLHPPPPLAGVSIGTERGYQQKNDSLADGCSRAVLVLRLGELGLDRLCVPGVRLEPATGSPLRVYFPLLKTGAARAGLFSAKCFSKPES